MKLLPENPTQSDYLHAIRAVAARGDMSAVPKLKEIFQLADDGMNTPEPPLKAAAPDLLEACKLAIERTPSNSKTLLPILQAAVGKALGHSCHNVEVKYGHASPPKSSDGL